MNQAYKNFPRVLDALAPALVFALGGWRVLSHELSIGQVFVMIGLLPALNAPIRSTARVIMAFNEADVRMRRVSEYLSLPNEPGYASGLERVDQLAGEIVFDHVSYVSEENSAAIVKDVSFAIRPGETVAIVGPSGAGKSTLLRLIYRLLDPSGGRILLDGRDVSTLDARSLRVRISVLTQETFLFNGTVLENATSGLSAGRRTLEQVMQSTRPAPVAQGLLDGQRGPVGARGARLSGGQRQLIAIIRALVRPSDIVLMDEPSSALDAASEVQVLEAIRQLMGEQTHVYCTHRLRSAVAADRILVIRDGALVESGTHADLLAHGRFYPRLWQAQQVTEDGQIA